MDEVKLHHHNHLLFDKLFGFVEGSVLLILVGRTSKDGCVYIYRSWKVSLDGLTLSTPLPFLWCVCVYVCGKSGYSVNLMQTMFHKITTTWNRIKILSFRLSQLTVELT